MMQVDPSTVRPLHPQHNLWRVTGQEDINLEIRKKKT
jgi:hypothetical protein